MYTQGLSQCGVGPWVEIEKELPTTRGGIAREPAGSVYSVMKPKETENAKLEPALPGHSKSIHLSK